MMLALCVVVAMTGSVGEGQDQFPDVTEEHYKTRQIRDQGATHPIVEELKQRGVIPSQSPTGHRLSNTRYEDAVAIHAAYQAFAHDPKIKHRLGVHYRYMVGQVWLASALLEHELASMGVNVAAMKLHLRALALGEGFPDVPPTHWASKATRELKDLGLLKGYPDGLFRGE